MTSLLQKQEEGVLILTINRPDRENRIDRALACDLCAALRSARADANVRAVVLTGAGKVFCLGGDLGSFPGGTAFDYLGFANAFSEISHAMAGLGKPLFAAVNGDAFAGGFSLIAGCDMAIVASDARLGLPELEYGLFPLLALATTHALLPPKLMFEIIYESRLLTADEACALHLANRTAPREKVLSEALTLAQRIGSKNATGILFGRDTYYAMQNTTLNSSNDQARFALSALLSTNDAREAAKAKREGRKPKFTGD
jgi:enoyl-CoA hydratase/carnithine racemase